jgi:hypothetical protein
MAHLRALTAISFHMKATQQIQRIGDFQNWGGYATFRGPFFAFSNDVIFAYRQTVDAGGELLTRKLHPMQVVDRARLEPGSLGNPRLRPENQSRAATRRQAIR